MIQYLIKSFDIFKTKEIDAKIKNECVIFSKVLSCTIEINQIIKIKFGDGSDTRNVGFGFWSCRREMMGVNRQVEQCFSSFSFAKSAKNLAKNEEN